MRLKFNYIFLIQLLYLFLSGITAVQKIVPLEIPQWFIKKFEPTLIGLFPYGIQISFIIITLLETIISLMLVLSILKKEYKDGNEKIYITNALSVSLILFVILFFGSFLSQGYENGALDFLYFIGTLYILDFINKKKFDNSKF